MLSENYAPNFQTYLQQKDLRFSLRGGAGKARCLGFEARCIRAEGPPEALAPQPILMKHQTSKPETETSQHAQLLRSKAIAKPKAEAWDAVT
jgi:hypothetical protein